MRIEILTLKEKRSNENTYLQVAALGSPQSYEDYNGEKPTAEHVALYSLLKNTPDDQCLNEWRKLAYSCDVAHNRVADCDYIVEEDDFGIYLMAKVDSVFDIEKKQRGIW